jgi:hypothetical protein
MKGPTDPLPPVPLDEEVDKELRQALVASWLTFVEEEGRRGGELPRLPGEGSSRGVGVPPEEEAYGVGELAGEVTVVPQEEGDTEELVGEAASEGAPQYAGGEMATVQGERTPTGLVDVSFVCLFMFCFFCCMMHQC